MKIKKEKTERKICRIRFVQYVECTSNIITSGKLKAINNKIQNYKKISKSQQIPSAFLNLLVHFNQLLSCIFNWHTRRKYTRRNLKINEMLSASRQMNGGNSNSYFAQQELTFFSSRYQYICFNVNVGHCRNIWIDLITLRIPRSG